MTHQIKALVLALLSVLTLTVSPAFSKGGGWASESSTSIARYEIESIVVDIAPKITATGNAKEIDLEGVEAGDTFDDIAFGGVRTFSCLLTDSEASGVTTTFKITGRNQFGGTSSETFAFSEDGLMIGTVPFVANPRPLITCTSISDSETTATISISTYGFGIRGAPVKANNVRSELIQVAGSPVTYVEETQENDWDFTERYVPKFSVYQNPDLAKFDEVRFVFLTQNKTITAIGTPDDPSGSSIQFVETITEVEP